MTGFVLAGGQSSRMGTDKALLEFGGESLVQLALTRLRATCDEVRIAGGKPELGRYAPLVPDLAPGCGPLGGIVSALAASGSEWNLFCPVDVPFLPVQALRSLLACKRGSGCIAVLSETPDHVNPLVALYARSALPVLKRELDAGHWKVRRAIEAAGAVELCKFTAPAMAAWFTNVNTPEQMAEARARSGAAAESI